MAVGPRRNLPDWDTALWQRLLGRPASESGTLRHGDGTHGRSDRCRRSFVLPILSIRFRGHPSLGRRKECPRMPEMRRASLHGVGRRKQFVTTRRIRPRGPRAPAHQSWSWTRWTWRCAPVGRRM
mgnify:CR=1 FL=1